MPNYTDNYNLYKPNKADTLQVDTTLTDNFTTIDTEIKNRANEISEHKTSTTAHDSANITHNNGSVQDKLAQVDADIQTVNKRVDDIGTVNADAELVNARGSYPQLMDRLNNADEQLAESALMFGVKYSVVKDGVTSDVTPFVNVLNDAITIKKTIRVPAGRYIFDTGIIQDLGGLDLEIEGEGKYNTVFSWRGGASTMFTFNNGRNVRFKNITVTGYDPTKDSTVLTVGSVGIKAQASLIFENACVIGFDKLFVWNGGYYHKFTNCEFRYFKTGFSGFNANNLTFVECKSYDFETLVEVNGGSGSVSYIGGSIEKWVNQIFNAISGSAPHLYLTGTYIENYPDSTPPSGITGLYNAAYGALGFGSVTSLGNTIIAKGIKRFIYGTSTLRSVTSKGNRIDYAGLNSEMDYFIYKSNAETVNANDVSFNTLTGLGTFTPTYLNNTSGLNNNTSRVYDPFTKKDLALPLNPWITSTLLNSWVQSGTSGNSVIAYRKNGNRVQIKGIANGATATSQVIFTLPTGYIPSEYVYKATTNTTGTAVYVLKILTNGDVMCTTTGVNGIILDGLEFDLV